MNVIVLVILQIHKITESNKNLGDRKLNMYRVIYPLKLNMIK